MTPFVALFVYLLVWWVMLFTILPYGVQRHEEHGKGYDAGAPAKTHLGWKLLANTILAAVILGIIQVLVVTHVIDWHGWFQNAWK